MQTYNVVILCHRLGVLDDRCKNEEMSFLRSTCMEGATPQGRSLCVRVHTRTSMFAAKGTQSTKHSCFAYVIHLSSCCSSQKCVPAPHLPDVPSRQASTRKGELHWNQPQCDACLQQSQRPGICTIPCDIITEDPPASCAHHFIAFLPAMVLLYSMLHITRFHMSLLLHLARKSRYYC